jgi:putative addiction module killer protein
MRHVAQVDETEAFVKWLKGLRDQLGRRAIMRRIARIVSTGNFGDCASVGSGVSELRIHVGPGYRIYYTIREEQVVLLLSGGDKGSQDRDIENAKRMASELE